MRYLYVRTDDVGPSVDEQLQAATEAGLLSGKLQAEVVIEEPGVGGESFPRRAAMIASLLRNDEVVVSSSGRLGPTISDIKQVLREIAGYEASVRSLHGEIRVPATAGPLLDFLDEAVSEGHRTSALRMNARSRRRTQPPRPTRALPNAKLAAARADWADVSLGRAEVASRYGVSERTLYREFGPREESDPR